MDRIEMSAAPVKDALILLAEPNGSIQRNRGGRPTAGKRERGGHDGAISEIYLRRFRKRCVSHAARVRRSGARHFDKDLP
jgi:hypothetical protein